ncbi:MAG: OB-fold nucleic acid binding domain-containing protein [Candidatus Aenigmatarchaeota archaeon]
MKIKELKIGMSNVNIKAKVAKLSEPREIMTRFGTPTTLTEATLEDESGSIKMTLWGKQSEGIKEGNEVEVKGGFVKEFREELQLGIRRGGEIKVVE